MSRRDRTINRRSISILRYNDRHSQASTYHQLGIVAQALREYEQARSHYQQALDIKIEYNDRYSQASTYSQLGLLSETLEEFGQAQLHHLEDLRICTEFNDQHRIAFTLQNLGRVYKSTQEKQLLSAVGRDFGRDTRRRAAIV